MDRPRTLSRWAYAKSKTEALLQWRRSGREFISSLVVAILMAYLGPREEWWIVMLSFALTFSVALFLMPLAELLMNFALAPVLRTYDERARLAREVEELRAKLPPTDYAISAEVAHTVRQLDRLGIRESFHKCFLAITDPEFTQIDFAHAIPSSRATQDEQLQEAKKLYKEFDELNLVDRRICSEAERARDMFAPTYKSSWSRLGKEVGQHLRQLTSDMGLFEVLDHLGLAKNRKNEVDLLEALRQAAMNERIRVSARLGFDSLRDGKPREPVPSTEFRNNRLFLTNRGFIVEEGGPKAGSGVRYEDPCFFRSEIENLWPKPTSSLRPSASPPSSPEVGPT